MKTARQFGPRIDVKGVTFRLWAPAAQSVTLLADGAWPMARDTSGWFEITRPDAGAGTLYKFRIDDELEVPGPASRFQPEDVHGPSEVIDQSFAWASSEWKGRPWFLQNHDQIGNRALGERLTKLAPATALEAAIIVTLLAPAPPLMFMGDEWGSQQPTSRP